MGRSNTGSASNWLAASGTPVTAVPMTLACWFNPATTTTAYNLIVVDDSGTGSNYFNLTANNVSGGHIDAGTANSGSGEHDARTTTAFVANQWSHAAAVYSGSANRAAYLNGGGKATDVTNITPISIAGIQLGGFRVGSNTFGPLNGIIAEAGIWNAALSDGEIWQLSQGAPPWKIRPDSLVGHWLPRIDTGVAFAFDYNPFRRRKYDMTVNGSMILDAHSPRMRYPVDPKRRYWTTGGRNAGTTGIAFDAASNSGDQAAVSSITFNVPWSGTDRMLAVDANFMGAAGTVSSVTYGGATCSLIGAQNVVGGTGRTENWRIIQADPGAPATGSNSLVVTLSGVIADMSVSCVSYTGVDQTSPTEAWAGNSGINAGSGTDATDVVTPVTDNTWVHWSCATSQTSGVASSQTLRNTVSGAGGSGLDSDTNALVSPASAQTGRFTGQGITSAWAVGGFAIRPVQTITYIPYDLVHSPGFQPVMAM